MEMFGVMILYLHVSSSIGDTMDDKHCLSDIYIDQASQCEQKKDLVEKTYDSVSQSMKFVENSKDSDTSNIEIKNKYNLKDGMQSTLQRDIGKRIQIDAVTNSFFNDNFPTSYHKYNFSTGEELNVKRRLHIIEQSVNEAVVTKNQTKIKESLSKCAYLTFLYINKYGPVARLYIQMADCMASMAQLVYSKPMFNSAMILFDQVMVMPALSDAQFTLIAKRQFKFLSLRRDWSWDV